MKTDIQNLHMFHSHCAIGWSDSDGYRYHFFVETDGTDGERQIPAEPLAIRESSGPGARYPFEIYRNTALDRPATKTVYLNADSARWRPTVAEALRRAQAEGLWQKALDEWKADEGARLEAEIADRAARSQALLRRFADEVAADGRAELAETIRDFADNADRDLLARLYPSALLEG